MKKQTDKPERDTTSVSIRFKNSVLANIDRIASAENRTRANVIETLVIEAVAVRALFETGTVSEQLRRTMETYKNNLKGTK
jgi:hypothetical protein